MSVLTRRARPPALQWLASVAQGWAEQADIWRGLVRPDATGRWVEPLAVNERSEVWLQGWPAGERVELHDHGGASGALCVVGGQLVETWATDLYSARLRQRRLDVGAVSAFGPEYVHDVVNAGRAPALTIQVYTPRLVSMTFYSFRRGRGLEPVRTELSDHPVVDTARR